MALAQSPRELIDLVIERADALRKAGVRRLEIGGAVIELAPHEVELHDEDAEPRSDRYVDPLDDPATYGLRGFVPGFQRQKEEP